MAKAVEATQDEESKISDENDAEKVYDAIIVGAGAAGVGVAISILLFFRIHFSVSDSRRSNP